MIARPDRTVELARRNQLASFRETPCAMSRAFRLACQLDKRTQQAWERAPAGSSSEGVSDLLLSIGSAFLATNTSMVYPQYWDVDFLGQLLQIAP